MKDAHRRAMLAKVHMAKSALAMTDDSYRALLRRETGCDSAKDLDEARLDAVIRRFVELGWQPSKRRASRHGPEAQRGRIGRLLDEAGRPAAYADAMAKRMYGRERVALLAPHELRGVIAALEKDRAKRAPGGECS